MDCINGGKPAGPDGVHLAPAYSQHNDLEGKSAARGGTSMATTLWLVFTTCVAIAALILGAWATSKANNNSDVIYNNFYPIQQSSAFLVSDPQDWQQYEDKYNAPVPMFQGTGYWNQMKNMKFQRSDHGTIPVGSGVLIFGGLSNTTDSPTVLNNTVLYDTVTGDLTDMADMPTPRYRFAYANLDGKYLFIFGGFSRYDPGDGSVSMDQTVMKYDISANTWQLLPASANLPVPRSDLCGGAASGKVYAVGGYDVNFITQDSVFVLDPATNVWSTAPSLQVSRGDCKAVGMDGKLYVMGGVTSITPAGVDCNVDWIKCYEFSKKTDVYDPATRQWTSLADMNAARGDFAVDVKESGRIMVAGGENGNGIRNQVATQGVEEYVAKYNIWVRKAPLPEARFRFDIAHVGELLYAFGGAPTCLDAAADTADLCPNNGLKTVWGFFDIRYPDLFAIVKKQQ